MLRFHSIRKAGTMWWIAPLVLALILTWTGQPAAAKTHDVQLPAVVPFATARFDLLSTDVTQGRAHLSYGSGMVRLPDQSWQWIADTTTINTTRTIQVGQQIWISSDGGAHWSVSDFLPFGNTQNLNLTRQVAQIADNAYARTRIGTELVRGISSTHFQLWLRGADVLAIGGNSLNVSMLSTDFLTLFQHSTYKYDLWIGADGRLYQQNIVWIAPPPIPGSFPSLQQINTLVTYYDFDDPSITISAAGQ
jgi:hypothetical protein